MGLMGDEWMDGWEKDEEIVRTERNMPEILKYGLHPKPGPEPAAAAFKAPDSDSLNITLQFCIVMPKI